MRDTLVLTLIGQDRKGLIEALAARIVAHDGNWEAGHMARLAGQFAGILKVTVERARIDELLAALRALGAGGLQVVVVPSDVETAIEGTRVRLALTGNDRPGIVREVSRILVELGVNIEELQSQVSSAPMAGGALFTAKAQLLVPAQVTTAQIREALEALSNGLMVDLTIEE